LHPERLSAFDKIVAESTAGLPQDENVKWTHLSISQIISQQSDLNLKISRYHVKQMLKLCGYMKRKLLKMNDLSHAEQHNQQFEKIIFYRKQFTEMDFPILSIS
jgi:hypothetical protein